MKVDLRVITPAELCSAAQRHPGSVFVCGSDAPPAPADLVGYMETLSTPGRPVDAAGIRTIRNEPVVTDSTALSLAGLEPHTDGAFLSEPPRRVILSCSVADGEGGGASTLIPVDFVVESAPEWALEALMNAQYLFLRTYDGDLSDAFTGPVLRRDEDGAFRIRWRGDHIYRPQVRDARGTRAGEAVDWLYELLSSCEPVTYLLQESELMLVPNDLVIHGRRALSPGSAREMLRAWIF